MHAAHGHGPAEVRELIESVRQCNGLRICKETTVDRLAGIGYNGHIKGGQAALRRMQMVFHGIAKNAHDLRVDYLDQDIAVLTIDQLDDGSFFVTYMEIV